MAEVTLYGNNMFCNAIIKKTENINDLSAEIKKFKDIPFVNNEWDSNSVLNVLFYNDSISGSNFSGDFSNIKHFEIYKKYSNQEKLYKVASTVSSSNCIVEDFVVGNKCPYTYYIFPICTDENGEVMGTLLRSDSIELSDNIIRVIALEVDENDYNKYYIDQSNIWNIYIDVEDNGFQNNMARSYNDTLNKYQKEIVGNGSYRTHSIKGSLSKIDCDKKEFTSSYDDIIEWEKFINSSCLKLLIDLRGIVTIGSIESNSCEYDQNADFDVNVNFTFRELDDIDHVEIINPQLIINPIYNNLLADVNPDILLSTETNETNCALVIPK